MKTPTAETRKGSPVLLVVLVVLSLVVTSVYFREGESGPLHSTRRGLLFLTTPFAAAGNVVASPFQAVGRWFGGFAVDRDELATLRAQNAEMRATIAELEEQRQENARLREMLKLPDTVRAGSLAAHVIGRPTDSWEGTILIDRGVKDGVKVGTTVVAAQGLLGQVVVAGPSSATVRLITDQSAGVAVLVQRTRGTGVVKGSVEGELSLQYAGGKELPKTGDVLVTSGHGGSYPKGLVVGDVGKVEPDPVGLFPTVEVVSRVPIDDIEEVLVLVGAQPSQILGGVE